MSWNAFEIIICLVALDTITPRTTVEAADALVTCTGVAVEVEVAGSVPIAVDEHIDSRVHMCNKQELVIVGELAHH